ncbi:MAG: ABC transporter ATP-binding protein [Ilumatobacteraceae bacterium]
MSTAPVEHRTDGGEARAGDKIVATDVMRYFGGAKSERIHALGPIDVTISDGEFVCLVGPSGCGKSTFLRMVAGLIRPSEGVVEFSTRRSSQSTAMVFQDYSIFPWKRVIDNVRYGLDLRGVGRKESKARAQKYLDKLGLGERANSWPDTLSGGMKQRVAIARALTVEPEILLMDEPFAALDAQMRQILQDELLDLWQAEQRTVLFVTHSLEEAVLLGDRVLVMSARPGRIIADITVPFERPRAHEIRQTTEFAAMTAELWKLLRLEVEETRALDAAAAAAAEHDSEEAR